MRKICVLASFLFFLVLYLFRTGVVSASIPTDIVGNSYVTGSSATATTNSKHIIRTSDGTLHAIFQTNSATHTCGGLSKSGLLYFSSSDAGITWTCISQINSSTSYNSSIAADSSGNIYFIYGTFLAGASGTAQDIFYRKLTRTSDSAWSIGAEQTVLDSTSSSTGYAEVQFQLEGDTRIWLAVRYYDGANFQIQVYYSDGLSSAPVWTQSTSLLDTAGANSGRSNPLVVRFSSHIGVIYNKQSDGFLYWRTRSDTDALDSWSAEGLVMNNVALSSAIFSGVGHTNGNVYLSVGTATVYFTYWNGSSWSSATTVATGATSNTAYVETNGESVWVVYVDNTGLSTYGKFVYKRGDPPFASSNFDATATSIVSYHGVYDKVWGYFSSAYTDVTTAAGNTTAADTSMVTAVGDIMYFGKDTKYDVVTTRLSTAGVGGVIAWEYWNGSSWSTLTVLSTNAQDFSNSTSWVSFDSPSDWAATSVNGESSSYYYIRARVTTAFTTSPVGTQFHDIPFLRHPSLHSSYYNGGIYAIWSENDSLSSTRLSKVRFSRIATFSLPQSLTNSGPSSCSDSAPTSPPSITSVVPGTTTAKIYFSQASDPVTHYALEFGTQSGSYIYGSTYIGGRDARSYTVNYLTPGEKYYFRIRAGNGCATGPWSSEASQVIRVGGSYSVSITPKPSASPSISPLGSPVPTYSPKPTSLATPTPSPVSLQFRFPQIDFRPFFNSVGHIMSDSISGFGKIAGGMFTFIKESIAYAGYIVSDRYTKQVELIGKINTWIVYTRESFWELVMDGEPTKISGVKVAEVGSTSAIITWKTNHLSTSKVNYGETLDYGLDVQSDEKVREHRVEIINLRPGVKYYYEVMSQNKNYVYDAHHEFETPK